MENRDTRRFPRFIQIVRILTVWITLGKPIYQAFSDLFIQIVRVLTVWIMLGRPIYQAFSDFCYPDCKNRRFPRLNQIVRTACVCGVVSQ